MAYFIGSTISIGSCLWIGFTNASTDIHYVYVVAVFIGKIGMVKNCFFDDRERFFLRNWKFNDDGH